MPKKGHFFVLLAHFYEQSRTPFTYIGKMGVVKPPSSHHVWTKGVKKTQSAHKPVPSCEKIEIPLKKIEYNLKTVCLRE